MNFSISLSDSIKELHLSTRIEKRLLSQEIDTVDKLLNTSAICILQTRGLGKKSIMEITLRLKEMKEFYKSKFFCGGYTFPSHWLEVREWMPVKPVNSVKEKIKEVQYICDVLKEYTNSIKNDLDDLLNNPRVYDGEKK